MSIWQWLLRSISVVTALTTRPVRESTDSLLRFALRADATLCAALGLFVAMAADPLSPRAYRMSGVSVSACSSATSRSPSLSPSC